MNNHRRQQAVEQLIDYLRQIRRVHGLAAPVYRTEKEALDALVADIDMAEVYAPDDEESQEAT